MTEKSVLRFNSLGAGS